MVSASFCDYEFSINTILGEYKNMETKATPYHLAEALIKFINEEKEK